MSKITIERSVLEQALEDMEMTINYVQSPTRREDMRDSIEALRAALEQEKSPQNASSALQASCEVPQVTDQTEHFLVLADEEVYCTKHPQVEQPVAWEGRDGYLYHFIEEPKPGDRPLYTNPQPPRQPLTEMDIVNLRQLVPGTLDAQFVKFARVIEAAHHITGEQE